MKSEMKDIYLAYFCEGWEPKWADIKLLLITNYIEKRISNES